MEQIAAHVEVRPVIGKKLGKPLGFACDAQGQLKLGTTYFVLKYSFTINDFSLHFHLIMHIYKTVQMHECTTCLSPGIFSLYIDLYWH